MTDTAAMREALAGISGLFLLSAVRPDELTAILLTLSLAKAAGVRDVVYLSVIHADTFTDPPHFAAKGAAERMIANLGLAATILRPSYYMQNDSAELEEIHNDGVYTPPVGSTGVLMTDVRDLGAVAAESLLRRQRSGEALPPETIDVVAPQVLTGDAVAGIWSDALGRPVRYGGDDLNRYEARRSAFVPGWMAYDMRLMM